jgi:site-specific DNA-methyltransferase (adenine-specific)
VWAALGLKHEDVALLWADPPYGVKERTDRSSRNRRGPGKYPVGTGPDGVYRPKSRVWPKVDGDDKPFDPAPLLTFPRAVLWGANFYASRLPDSHSWWAWDKTDEGRVVDDNADVELAWTNIGGMPRRFPYLWKGMCQETKDTEGGLRLHPTMKPVALATWGFQRAKLKPGDLVFSPYMGSGPEARAALDMGLRFIGCEIVEEYCRAAVSRLRQRPLFADGV